MEIVSSVLTSLGFDPVIFASQLVLFYVMHLLLTPVLYRPLEKVRNERDARTHGKLAEAERINNEALELKARYEAEIRQARQAAQAVVQQASQEAEAAKVARMETARNEAETRLEATRREVAAERERAETELVGKVQDLSLAVASRLVEGSASEPERQRLVGRLREAS